MKFVKLQSFLEQNGWTANGSNDKFLFYKPPIDLGFQEDYSFLLLKNTNDNWYLSVLEDYVKTLSGIYDKSFDDLLNMIENSLSVFSMRIVDESTKVGSLDFSYFNAITGTIRNSLYSSAYYVIKKDKEKGNIDADERSKFYVNSCKILQTERGSFITKIGLPDELSLAHGNLFSTNEIKAKDVNNSFISIIEHINNTFFQDILPTVDDIASDNFMKEIILGENGFQLIKNIKSIYNKSIGKSLDYKLFARIGLEEKEVITNVIDKKNTDNFDTVIKTIEKELKTEKLECTGYVYLTRSKNPLENKNHIELTETEFGPGVKISINLDSDLYQKAIDAHAKHQKIRIVGEMTKINKTYSTDSSKIETFTVF